MATGHTKGPWCVDATNALGAYGVWTDYATHPGHDGAGYGSQVCSLRPDSTEISREERDANARLIAAAPDLLAACKRADSLLAHLMKTVDWGKTFDLQIGELNGVLLDLPRAIAKAEGAANLDPKGS